ncbi:uncharacterized protein ColSpa_08456 [Colletotrichum spaethianum]|uniref:Uncharacterized protein n=1 Tax=Colletotrichum spaethianum TaxID=700344 RepID=A0AA37P9R9_9PEZI|nr:uncharacterized protein ColSpa_08456 [Colletotrichum spaethianum]GKT48275.1 hypothetical protein ColSpa_08456 [Colletotrichum spaethianum]
MWSEYSIAVSKGIEFGSLNSGRPTLSPGAFTTTIAPEWSPVGPLQLGILDNPEIRETTTRFSEHAYSGAFILNRDIQPGDLMNKINIRNNLTTKTTGMRAVRSEGLEYVLAETNSYAK